MARWVLPSLPCCFPADDARGAGACALAASASSNSGPAHGRNPWSLDEVTRLHDGLRDVGGRPNNDIASRPTLVAPAASALMYMERNLNIVKDVFHCPERVCRNNTGPSEVNRTAIAATIITGRKINSVINATNQA